MKPSRGTRSTSIDIYSTDAKLDKYGLTVLEDDRKYFPRYDAVLLYRADLPQRLPKTWAALAKLEGTIDDAAMRRMNAAAELEGKDFATVAANFLARQPQSSAGAGASVKAGAFQDFWSKLFGPDFARLTLEQLGLVFLSLAASIVDRHPARDPRREASGDRGIDHRRDRRRADDSLARAPRHPDPLDRTHRRGAGVHRSRACTRCCPSCAIRIPR